MILTVIRDPIELIFSYYHHLLKPEVHKVRGMTKENIWGHPKLALSELDVLINKSVKFDIFISL